MDFETYQSKAARTMNKESSPRDALCNMAMGIAGECGELVDCLKKHVFHGHPVDNDKLASEIGDVLWYLAGLSTTLGLSLDVVASGNINKLRKRYPEGFSEQRSINRAQGVAAVAELL